MVRVYEQIKMSVVFIIISKRIKKALSSVFIVNLGLNIVLSKLCSNYVPAIYALMGNHNSERCVYYTSWVTDPASADSFVYVIPLRHLKHSTCDILYFYKENQLKVLTGDKPFKRQTLQDDKP